MLVDTVSREQYNKGKTLLRYYFFYRIHVFGGEVFENLLPTAVLLIFQQSRVTAEYEKNYPRNFRYEVCSCLKEKCMLAKV